MKNYLGLLSLILVMYACGSNKESTPQGMSDEEYQNYKQILTSVQTIEQSLDQISTPTAEQAIEIAKLSGQLVYDYDPMGMDSATQAACSQLKERIYNLRGRINEVLSAQLPLIRVDVQNFSDHLMEKTEAYPVYLKKGDTLFVEASSERACTMKVYNVDSKATLLTRSGKCQYNEKLFIKNSAIYLVEINPNQAQYADVHIAYSVPTMERLQHPVRVTEEEVEAQKGDWRATTIKGIKMQSLFEEPRKFTLRGQLKAAFSGSYRAIVAVQVPAGATDILYSLRISTNEQDKSSDGKFPDHMETSYRRIKMLGLPVYESHKGSGLIATLLGENTPVREEDAYINLYVFYDAGQARKFQDGKDPATIKYNIDYSKMGTQSCNDRIPTRGYRTVYLGFLNERMRYNNYVWLEAVSAVPTTEYFKTKYTCQ